MNNWRPGASFRLLQKRARMLKDIRNFFAERDIMEVETPLLSRFATTDPHLDSLQTRFRDQCLYLNTSPEYCMKRLLADNAVPIYQISKAFRDNESGPHHNPEFTMLEWYRPGFDLQQLMDEVTGLINMLMAEKHPGVRFQTISYQQVFEDYAGFNPHAVTVAECLQCANQHAIDIPVGLGAANDDLDDWLDWLLTQLVLPRLPRQEFSFIYDYPASQAALARIETSSNGYPVARRFELLYGELELANAFYELTDAAEQRLRFNQENSQRTSMGKPTIEMDTRLLTALEQGVVDCAGVAIGLDRLLMVLSECHSIDQVLAFSWQQA